MSNRPGSLRVLHVIPSVAACRGGPSQAVLEMVAVLRKSGINAEIATSNDNGTEKLDVPTGELIEYQGVPVRFFNRISTPVAPLREFSYAPGLSRWLNKHLDEYDILHVHAIFSYCSTRAMQVARRKGVPYIIRPIGQLEHWSLQQSKTRKSYYLQWFEQKNIEQAQCIHFTSRSEQTQAQEVIGQTPNEVIPLGLDLPMQVRSANTKIQQRWSLERETPTILFMSRLHPKKGLELLLDALASLSFMPFQLVIAGQGEDAYVQSLQTRIRSSGLEQRCHFVGFVKGAEKSLLLQGADLYVLTSHSENFGVAVLEAMAAGTAVLVSKQVALSEQVAAHKAGFVTSLDVADIMAKLRTALSDPELMRDYGEAARLFVENKLQWTQIAHRLEAMYRRCLKSN